MICSGCKAQNQGIAVFCAGCGTKLTASSASGVAVSNRQLQATRSVTSSSQTQSKGWSVLKSVLVLGPLALFVPVIGLYLILKVAHWPPWVRRIVSVPYGAWALFWSVGVAAIVIAAVSSGLKHANAVPPIAPTVAKHAAAYPIRPTGQGHQVYSLMAIEDVRDSVYAAAARKRITLAKRDEDRRLPAHNPVKR